ncbi:hypothetical protein SAMD00019534_113060, partial [Acytostelium subglobosum LB1]|uniref:hypothetical protein n=1 Tax=Acytostelium subglobosum LB1 TaxID=1410327 RepID=UPI000644C191
ILTSTTACRDSSYITIPLGTSGGLDDSDLSSFLLTKKGSNLFITFDAGTIWTGVSKFLANKNYVRSFNIVFPQWATQEDQQIAWFVKNYILAYVIGHPHLDHVAGLVEASPEDYLPSGVLNIHPPIETGLLALLKHIIDPILLDSKQILSKKTIVGLPNTIQAIKDNLFNNLIWPNLPDFGRYDYYTMKEGHSYDLMELVFLNNSDRENLGKNFPNNVEIKPFPTCHNDMMSTAFLLTDKITGDQIVFFSDTGIPSENVIGITCDYLKRIRIIWQSIHINKLKAIFLECSYTNSQPSTQLFGHLRPKDVIPVLAELIDYGIQTTPKTMNLRHVKLVVQHIKPMANQSPTTNFSVRQLIYKELSESNKFLGIQIIIPEQGEPICL